MPRRRVHLIAAGSPAGADFPRFGFDGVRDLRDRIAESLGGQYLVTADARCLLADEDDQHGGRTDDVRRARDVQRALAEDRVAAIVALRGGAWFTRVLHRIDFDVLRRRDTPVCVIGSSEMTSLVNIVARYRRGVGIHDIMPLFVLNAVPKRSALHAFDAYWQDVRRMIAGQPSSRVLTGTLLSGTMSRRATIRAVGGNLTLVSTLMGSPFARAVSTRRRWLAIEDVNEKPERIDRMLAQLRLSGMMDGLEGVLLGDFHRGDEDLRDAVAACLRYHLPDRRVPVVQRCDFGHVWPAAPLRLNQPLPVRRVGREVRIGVQDG